MSLRKVNSLGSNLASVTDLKRIQKEFKLHTVYAVIQEAIKALQLIGHVTEFKFQQVESKFEPLPVIWQSLLRLFQKVIKGLEGKITELTAKLLGQLSGSAYAGGTVSDWRAQTQGASEQAAVAVGLNRLA